MKICFDAKDNTTQAFVKKLQLGDELGKVAAEKGEKCLDAPTIRAAGFNADFFQVLVLPPTSNLMSHFAFFPPSAPKVRISKPEAQLGLEILAKVEQLGPIQGLSGLALFKKWIDPESCFGKTPQQLYYFLRYVILNQPVPLEDEVSDVSKLSERKIIGLKMACDFNPELTSVMHDYLFTQDQLPPLIRRQALYSMVGFRSLVPKQQAVTATGIVVSPYGDVLVPAHGFFQDYRAESPEVLPNLSLITNSGAGKRFDKTVYEVGENLYHSFSGADLVLIHMPEIAGHPHVEIGTLDVKPQESLYILGIPSQVYDPSLGKPQGEGFHFENLNQRFKSIYWSVATTIPQPPGRAKTSMKYIYNNGYIPSGSSGGPQLVLRGNQVELVGINQDSNIAEKGGVQDSKGVSLPPLKEEIDSVIKAFNPSDLGQGEDMAQSVYAPSAEWTSSDSGDLCLPE